MEQWELEFYLKISIDFLSSLFLYYLFACADIPDDEAQYWTKKLERINSMRIHDEVQTVCLDGVEMRVYVQ